MDEVLIFQKYLGFDGESSEINVYGLSRRTMKKNLNVWCGSDSDGLNFTFQPNF